MRLAVAYAPEPDHANHVVSHHEWGTGERFGSGEKKASSLEIQQYSVVELQHNSTVVTVSTSTVQEVVRAKSANNWHLALAHSKTRHPLVPVS